MVPFPHAMYPARPCHDSRHAGGVTRAFGLLPWGKIALGACLVVPFHPVTAAPGAAHAFVEGPSRWFSDVAARVFTASAPRSGREKLNPMNRQARQHGKDEEPNEPVQYFRPIADTLGGKISRARIRLRRVACFN